MGFWKPVGIALLAFLVVRIVKLLLFLGVTKSIVHTHHPGPCHLVAGVVDGSEDIVMVDERRALISSGLRFSKGEVEMFPERRGQIFVYDLGVSTGGATAVQLRDVNLATFNPHGMSVWRDPGTGGIRVFVVNHPTDSIFDEVLIFKYDASKTTLSLVKTIRDDAFRVLNDVVATGEDTFYVTSCLYARGDLTRVVELMAMVGWGQILHYNGQTATAIASNLMAPNGINMSPDGKYVYVAMLGEASLYVYDRNTRDVLTLNKVHPLDTHPDNIDVDAATGDLWIATHPILWKSFAHAEAPSERPAPSQVLRLRMNGGEVDFIEEVFADAGRDLYASSVAVYKSGRMLIGTIYHKLMVCEVKNLGLKI